MHNFYCVRDFAAQCSHVLLLKLKVVSRHTATLWQLYFYLPAVSLTSLVYLPCFKNLMDLIHYSFAPLILFRIPYMLDLLPQHLSITNGAGCVGIFELLVFQCFT